MPKPSVLSKDIHTNLAENAGRPEMPPGYIPWVLLYPSEGLWSEAEHWLVLTLTTIQGNDHIRSLLRNMVWVSLHLETKES